MARGVNKVILVGNLGSDPDTRYMPNGNPVTNFSIATSESWKDKQTGEKQERTEWHRVVIFNRLAEIATEYLRKGSKVYVEGSLKTRKWQDQSGADKYTTEIVVSEMQMLDSRGTSPNAGFNNNSGFSNNNMQQNQAPQQMAPSQAPQQAPMQQQQHQQPSYQAPQQQQAAPAVTTAPVMDNFDDDIPF